MKQETFEEAAERLYPTPQPYELYKDIGNSMKREAFIAGAKWQEEQSKEMIKEQIINAFDTGHRIGAWNFLGDEYYEKTFKNETK